MNLTKDAVISNATSANEVHCLWEVALQTYHMSLIHIWNFASGLCIN